MKVKSSPAMVKAHTSHGHSLTPEYNIWFKLVSRCTQPHDSHYQFYGGANPPIRVCDRWNPARGGSFENFLADMGPRPSPQHSIGRACDLADYKLGGCFWQTREEQSLAGKNKRALLKWAIGHGVVFVKITRPRAERRALRRSHDTAVAAAIQNVIQHRHGQPA
jgi:hypothetical protein